MTNPGLGIPYALANNKLTAHWLVETPLPAAWIRAPGRMHNTFGNESFLDEIAAATGMDPFEIRLRHLDDQRGRELLERLRRFAKWEPRGSRARDAGTVVQGRGVSYVKYELVRTYVGIVADVTVDRTTGRIKVDRVWVVHDCRSDHKPRRTAQPDRRDCSADSEPHSDRKTDLQPERCDEPQLGKLPDSDFSERSSRCHRPD